MNDKTPTRAARLKPKTPVRDTHLKFTEEEWQKLAALAEKENRTVSNLIKTFVRDGLKKG